MQVEKGDYCAAFPKTLGPEGGLVIFGNTEQVGTASDGSPWLGSMLSLAEPTWNALGKPSELVVCVCEKGKEKYGDG